MTIKPAPGGADAVQVWRSARPTRSWQFVLFALIAGVAAPVLLAAGLHLHGRVTPRPGDVRITATVVDVATRCNRHCTYTPTLTFTANGRQVEVSGVGRSHRPSVGDTEAIAYDPADPFRVHDVGAGNWVWQVDLVFAAVLAVMSGLCSWQAVRLHGGDRDDPWTAPSGRGGWAERL